MLIIVTNRRFDKEKKYILDVIINLWWGIDYHIRWAEDACDYWVIEYETKKICLPNILFRNGGNSLISQNNLPDKLLHLFKIPDEITCVCERTIPIIYGNEIGIDDSKPNVINIPIDIFGSCFFMLTRLEEYINKDRDMHNRFSATSSVAYKNNFLLRPIVNEYLEILFHYIGRISDNKLIRKKNQYAVNYTCDIDTICQLADKGWLKNIRQILSVVYYGKSLSKAIKLCMATIKVKLFSKLESDPYFSFALINKILKKYNLNGKFYLLNKGESEWDRGYNFRDPIVIGAVNFLKNNGHTFGLHGSYFSYTNFELYKQELANLRGLFAATHINHSNISSRQHFLNWHFPQTIDIISNAGLNEDMTLGYADHVGFRCGVCYSYPLFNIIARKVTNIIENPLILMDCSLTDKRYMNLGHSPGAYKVIDYLKRSCRIFGGNFVVLWHNTRFIVKEDIKMLEYCLT